ncbi:carboxyl-terminal-processing peptidase 3 chloroplastic [Phtheirospermum japonicum]|uniref:C-terminal processing peptidase n=1 Tax=Phtheirospermum japonicum TaxID=374723 RepID=A0A830C2Q7_9LAMI|nr:carboxyl-terminal-processing peptidase 3 chloroplastic [Phtheirospermum japonicum]
MEALNSNLDYCTLSKFSQVSNFSSKFSSSCRYSRFNCRRNKNIRVKIVHQEKGSSSKNENGCFSAVNKDLVKRVLSKGVFGFAAAVSLFSNSPAFAESLTVAFPVSHTREVNTVQRTLVEAWSLIRETFVDPTFNHQDWDLKLQQTMVEMFPLRSEDAAYNKLKGMLSTLGDPFTRIISPKEYQSFRIGSDGNLQGVGLFVNVEPKTGHMVDDLGSSYVREVKIPREVIKLSPISSAIIQHRAPDGHLSKTGYVKLSTFSQWRWKTQFMRWRVKGGLVTAGLDVAQIWLDGTETLVNTIDRDGNMLPINMIDGHAITHDPLVVLVNEGSASASEILAGALHDNGRATLIGHRTFGKGKIQSVTELNDGSALFITVAKYLSPALHDIDQVGITPDVQCTTDFLNSPKDSFKNIGGSASTLERDSCILVAEHQLDIQESKGSAS